MPQPRQDDAPQQKQGDPDLELSESQLIDRFTPMVKSLLHKYVHRSAHEDAEQDAMMALIHARRQWDPERSRGGNFSSFAYQGMMNAVRNHQRKAGKNASTFAQMSDDSSEDNTGVSAGQIEDHRSHDGQLSLETSDLLDEAFQHIGPEEKQFLLEHIVHGRSLTDIAQAAGVSQQALSKRLAGIKSRIRDGVGADLDPYCRLTDMLGVYLMSRHPEMEVQHYDAASFPGQLARAGVHTAANLLVRPGGRFGAINRALKTAFDMWQSSGSTTGKKSPELSEFERKHGLNAGEEATMRRMAARNAARREMRDQLNPAQQPTEFEQRHGLKPGEEATMRRASARKVARAELAQSEDNPAARQMRESSELAKQLGLSPEAAASLLGKIGDTNEMQASDLHEAIGRRVPKPKSFSAPAAPSRQQSGPPPGSQDFEKLHPREGEGRENGGQFTKKPTSAQADPEPPEMHGPAAPHGPPPPRPAAPPSPAEIAQTQQEVQPVSTKIRAPAAQQRPAPAPSATPHPYTQVSHRQRSAIQAAARQHGVDELSLFERASLEHQASLADHQAKLALYQDVRQRWPNFNKRTVSNAQNRRSRIHTTEDLAMMLPGADEAVTELQRDHPGYNWSDEPTADVADLLGSGRPLEPALSDESLLNRIASELAMQRAMPGERKSRPQSTQPSGGFDEFISDAAGADEAGYYDEDPDFHDDRPFDPSSVPFARSLHESCVQVERYIRSVAA